MTKPGKVFLIASVLVAFGFLCIAFAENPVFPSISGYNLDGRLYQVPADFQGSSNLVILTFQREQQKDADGWAVAARKLEVLFPEFRYHEITAMEHRNVLLRWWWDSFIRKGIHDPETRDRTVVVYVSKRDFRQQLLIPDEKEIHLLLISRNGEIFWRARGVVDQAKQDALQQQLALLHR